MRVVVAGASGMIGSALVPVLRERGHDVVQLVRREPATDDERHWDPAAGRLDPAVLDGADAIVNLAGATLDQRWTQNARERILSSRVDTTSLLASVAAAAPSRPALVQASAVGVYGNRGDERLTEESVAGEGFLADVVKAWEAAGQPARDAGLRTVQLRQGIVLSRKGGAIAKLLLPFRLGLGGRVGSGRQYWAWVSLEDTIAAYVWAIEGDATGAVNVVAPQQVTCADFTSALGDVLGRPTVFPFPAFAVRLLFGQMGEEVLLYGQRVLPAVLERQGFAFSHPDIESGLRAALA